MSALVSKKKKKSVHDKESANLRVDSLEKEVAIALRCNQFFLLLGLNNPRGLFWGG